MSRSSRRTEKKRQGLTLFEVVLALGILLVAMAALGQLVSTGRRAATQSRLQTQAALICESKLSALLANAEPLQPGSNLPYELDPNWTWSLQVLPSADPDLLLLEVTVTSAQVQTGEIGTCTLRRLVRDPALYDAMLALETQQLSQ